MFRPQTTETMHHLESRLHNWPIEIQQNVFEAALCSDPDKALQALWASKVLDAQDLEHILHFSGNDEFGYIQGLRAIKKLLNDTVSFCLNWDHPDAAMVLSKLTDLLSNGRLKDFWKDRCPLTVATVTAWMNSAHKDLIKPALPRILIILSSGQTEDLKDFPTLFARSEISPDLVDMSAACRGALLQNAAVLGVCACIQYLKYGHGELDSAFEAIFFKSTGQAGLPKYIANLFAVHEVDPQRARDFFDQYTCYVTKHLAISNPEVFNNIGRDLDRMACREYTFTTRTRKHLIKQDFDL